MPIRKTGQDWTGEHVKRFWDWWAGNLHLQSEYFSLQVRKGVCNLLQFTGRLRGKVLDYGCGPGYLLEELASRGLETCGADFSRDSIAATNRRLAGRNGWRGAVPIDAFRTSFDPQSFDVITCTETVEHLTDEFLTPLLAEVRRLLKPGGIALFTTPFAENLSANLVYCPFCDSEFHRIQHVRNFTVESLSSLLQQSGFGVVYCKNVSLFNFQRSMGPPQFMDWGVRTFGTWAKDIAALAKDLLRNRSFGNSAEFRRRAQPGANLCAIVTPAATNG
jgi:SAM-dependent methyltransferase